MKYFLYLFLYIISFNTIGQNNNSIAKEWMDTLLEMVKEDGQGPTVQARNMFHLSAAMHDAWAAYDKKQSTYFLGKEKNGQLIAFNSNFKRISKNTDSLRNIAISYAAYKIIDSRFQEYGSKGRTIDILNSTFYKYQFKINKTLRTDYESGSPEALGNYIAQQVLLFGKKDGSKEEHNHELVKYKPKNKNLLPGIPGVESLNYPNHWQPIYINKYIAKKGYDKTLKDWNQLLINGNVDFLTPFWGEVQSFALPSESKEGMVHFNPGPPPHINTNNPKETEAYRWGFSLVQRFSSKLDSKNSKLWDISPKGITDIDNHLPTGIDAYKSYYTNVENNHKKKLIKNPITKKNYSKNLVKQGDYCRVIAEFWVDGPNTYSPPGHWLKFLNKVSYHPDFKRKWNGKGKVLSQLEWDIKSYFLLCGTMHDAAIACWSAKGYYDYVRPISAIRYLASLGQSSDVNKPNYNSSGLKLEKGLVELVTSKDSLVGNNKEHLNKVKIYNWRGPDAINNPYNDTAGVGWILAENWWPYQRYTFATPPFAGYTSGHSTFSIASAKLLTYISGSPYFPDGLETYTAEKNEFLGFENGPSETVTLQWATFYDAAIETCLSRVWGGIHPPVDDIEGRRTGKKVAENAIEFSKFFFN
ncbi:vanadium-dependent haloperoxidase [Aurantibacter sp.]|uniref:vanadium-dependent haloperoxidase n=1 Tax=Aurantibacter sp. TaxID=2807103 RepID=UPI0035C7BBF6